MKTFGEHQTYGATMMSLCDNLGIFYDMGCGKTATALLWARDAMREGMKDLLVVCPASLVRSWENAIDGMIEFEGFTEADVEMLKQRITLSSFQKTYCRKTSEHVISRGKNKGRVKKEAWYEVRENLAKRWGAILIDESHCIGSHSSVQTQVCIELATLTEKRFIMTATPTHGGGGSYDWAKLYGQVQFLEGGKMWRNWTDFCERYVISYDHWGKPRRYRDDDLKKVLTDHGIVARLEDCHDMPGFIDTVIPIQLAEKKVYKDIVAGILDRYDLEERSAGNSTIKLRQLVSGFLKTELGIERYNTNKAQALRDILSSTAEPLIIFCMFTESIAICKEICDDLKRSVAVFNGEERAKHGATWEALAEGRVDTLICQYQVGGPGLNLQRSAIIVFYEPCLSSLQLEQSRGRIYRIGQERRCEYIHLSTEGTVEAKTWQSVRNGVDVNDRMLLEWAREQYLS